MLERNRGPRPERLGPAQTLDRAKAVDTPQRQAPPDNGHSRRASIEPWGAIIGLRRVTCVFSRAQRTLGRPQTGPKDDP